MKEFAIGVFARAPEPGRAKTRLIPHLGEHRAARLQAALMRRAVERARGVPRARVTLWVDGALDHADVDYCQRAFGVEVHAQSGADLGSRMQAAVEQGAAAGQSSIIIGTDCPAQNVDDLIDACAALNSNDVVLQPALDGGYVLIGTKSHVGPLEILFGGIEWGTERVLATTRARLVAAKLEFVELRALPDLDRPEDLIEAVARGWIREEEFA
jgi:rSAM/selenodomain-associated transferase 1